MTLFFQTYDGFVLAATFAAYFIFLFVQFIALRYWKGAKANLIIFYTFIIGYGGYAALLTLNFITGGEKLGSNSLSLYLLSLGIGSLIYVLLVFHYLSLVFGMGESAIRIRLLRELNKRPSKSFSWEEILSSYNAAQILCSRLERLVSAGHLSFDGRHYFLRKRVLLIQAMIRQILRHLL